MINVIINLIRDNGPRGILFYNHTENDINQAKGELPKFDEVLYVAGDEYRELMNLLIELKRSRLH